MKIAWLCSEMIYPPNTGGRLVEFFRVKYAVERGCKVHLFLACKTEPDKASVEALEAICESVVICRRDSTRLASIFKSFTEGVPFAVANRTFSRIDEGVRSLEPDLTIVEMPQMLANLSTETCDAYYVVVQQQNVEWKTSASLAMGCKNVLRRALYERESRLMRRFEETVYGDHPVDLMTFLTDEDLADYSFAPGVDKAVLRPGARDCLTEDVQATRNMTFVANYTYQPNVNAALWFASHVLPSVWDKVPDAQFWMVGKNPPADLSHLAAEDSRVHVTGTVDDLAPYYRQTEVVVLPITEGGGVKMKALEAASANRTIVSTSFSLVGTGIKGGVHALVADDAEGFAADVVDALLRPDRYEGMRQACRRLYEEELSWGVANKRWMERVLKCVRNDGRTDGR